MVGCTIQTSEKSRWKELEEQVFQYSRERATTKPARGIGNRILKKSIGGQREANLELKVEKGMGIRSCYGKTYRDIKLGSRKASDQ